MCEDPFAYLEMPSTPKRKALDLWEPVLKSVHIVIMNSNICSISWIITGVCQLVNKMEETTGKVKPFNRNDEQFLEAFVIFCGLGIQNTQMYEAVERAMAKQMVTLEVGAPAGPLGLPEHTLRPPPLPAERWGSVTSLWPAENHVLPLSSLKQLRKLRPSILEKLVKGHTTTSKLRPQAPPLLSRPKAVLGP